MTRFELAYVCLGWVMPIHYRKVRKVLKRLIKGSRGFQLLDVGGRKSHYTIRLDCDVHIVDLPRESDLQKSLNLGVTEAMIGQIAKRRSNVKSIRLEDITQTQMQDAAFDGAVSVEVIEHVPDDSAFVFQVHRILKPGGWLVLTTPNGESVANVNPDHVRHYTRAQLVDKLKEAFDDVRVWYGVRRGYLRRVSLRPWLRRRGKEVFWVPWILLCCFLANVLEGDCSNKAKGTAKLFAVARKNGRREAGAVKVCRL